MISGPSGGKVKDKFTGGVLVKIKGILLIGTKEFITKSFGEKKWEEFLKTLPDHIVEPLKKIILPGGLYDLEIYTALNIEADKYFGTGDGKLLETIGKTTAEESMELYSSVFKRRLKTPRDMLEGLVPLLAKMLFEEIEAEDIEVATNEARYTLRGKFLNDPAFVEVLGKRSIGWIEEIFSKMGKKASANFLSGRDEKGPFITFEIRWE